MEHVVSALRRMEKILAWAVFTSSGECVARSIQPACAMSPTLDRLWSELGRPPKRPGPFALFLEEALVGVRTFEGETLLALALPTAAIGELLAALELEPADPRARATPASTGRAGRQRGSHVAR